MKLLGRKIKMTQLWENDVVVPVTVIKVEKQIADLDSLAKGDFVKISGVSKGKGFQGVVKRHGFGGGPQTHGQKNRQRAPGSIGATAPQRVIKGRKMAGHMGARRVTIKNLRIVDVKKEDGLLFLKGAVPGTNRTIIEIRK